MDNQQMELIRSLMKQHSASMVQLTYRRLGDWHLAEDLVQETFLTACCKANILSGHVNAVAWLYKTLNNLTLCEKRRIYHKIETGYDGDIVDDSDIDLPMDCYLPKGLNDKDRELILLRIEKRCSFQEIAEYFGITEAACRQRLSRTIRKCRTLLEEESGASTPK